MTTTLRIWKNGVLLAVSGYRHIRGRAGFCALLVLSPILTASPPISAPRRVFHSVSFIDPLWPELEGLARAQVRCNSACTREDDIFR